MYPFFSIIIPVYNVAPYLRECLDSVLAQTFTDWEAICVDDGSTDGSGALLDEYAARYTRFRVVHQQNAGVSAARNIALNLVEGKWLLFLDADDVLHKRMLEQLACYAKEDIDIILTKHKSISNLREFDNCCEIDHKRAVPVVQISCLEFYHPIFAAAYRSSKFSAIRFEIGLTIGEDRVWYVSALNLANRVLWVDFIGYGYRLREGSAIRSAITPKKFCDAVIHDEFLINIVAKSPEKFDVRIRRQITNTLLNEGAKDFLKLRKADKNYCLRIWYKVIKKAISEGFVPLSQRIMIRGFSVFGCEKITAQVIYIRIVIRKMLSSLKQALLKAVSWS